MFPFCVRFNVTDMISKTSSPSAPRWTWRCSEFWLLTEVVGVEIQCDSIASAIPLLISHTHTRFPFTVTILRTSAQNDILVGAGRTHRLHCMGDFLVTEEALW